MTIEFRRKIVRAVKFLKILKRYFSRSNKSILWSFINKIEVQVSSVVADRKSIRTNILSVKAILKPLDFSRLRYD